MRYAQIRELDISNGEGVGASLFVQGCHFHCDGCFNKDTWDFSGGKEWTDEVEQKFMSIIDKPYIQRVSFLGGEPLADENVKAVFDLIQKIKFKYPHKKVWVYTGYQWETLVSPPINNFYSLTRLLVLGISDILVDGQFQLDKQDLFNKEVIFAGSTNQRIIECSNSIMYGEMILHK